jgi:outer membrane biosynthesis protein TonB
MRLRKNMKRAAAAALALSVALSAAAPAALAKEYYIDDGNITVTVTEDGDTYVRVGDAKDDKDIGEKDDTEVVIKGGKNPDKQTENKSDGPADKDTADEAEGQKPVVDAEPGEPAEKTGTELIVWPENVNSGEAQKKDDPEPAEEEQKTPDTQKPEGKTDAATLEASTEQKPVEKAAEAADDDHDIMTYEDNTADTVTKAVNEAVKNVIKIINNCTKKDTTVTIKDVNIDVSGKGRSAMFVQGKGDTTLKLVGDNTLRGGDDSAGLEKDDEHSTGKLTITAENTSSSLNAYGGHSGAGIGGGNQRSTSNLEIANGKIHAVGGLLGAGIGGGGFGGNGEVSISGGEVTAQGGNFAAGIGGGAQGSGKVTIKNGKVTAKTNGAAAAIGGGIGGSGDVTILDGTVTATKNYDSYPVTGIGGASGSTKKSTVRILGGVVDAVGGGYGSGIGGGKGGVEVEIGGGAQVTAKGGPGNDGYGAGAAIGTNGEKGGKAGKEQDVNAIGEGTVTRVDSNLSAGHEHEWTLVSSTPAAVGQLGEKVYECPCGSTRTVYKFALPAPVEEEQNGRIVLTVIDALYEMHQESARCIVTADSDTATLFGCLGNLADLKAQGIETLVFRTKSRETALDIDTMLSLGAEDTLFTLTHSGSSATLTVGGADHSELIH